jgi:hypothetical protein
MGSSRNLHSLNLAVLATRRGEFAGGNWKLVLPVPYLRAWQAMSLSVSPSALGAVSRFAPRMQLQNRISTERLLYLS